MVALPRLLSLASGKGFRIRFKIDEMKKMKGLQCELRVTQYTVALNSADASASSEPLPVQYMDATCTGTRLIYQSRR